MRRFLIQVVLPIVFCTLPFLAAILVAAATPPPAIRFYLANVAHSKLDWLILGLGIFLFLAQMAFMWWSLQWRGTTFDERPDRWIANLSQAAEWFPMLGLIGTVTGILETFGQIAQNPSSTPNDIIKSYAPAITATGSGLLMALLNLLPSWVILMGRDMIMTLGGGSTPPPAKTEGHT